MELDVVLDCLKEVDGGGICKGRKGVGKEFYFSWRVMSCER